MAESQLEHWREWHDACALGRCSAAVADALRTFARNRMVGFVQRYATRTNLQRSGHPEVPAAEAWHLFETHLTATTTRAGKRYKDWLFARTRPEPERALPIIEAGASLIIRSVTRDWLRREFSPRGTVSLQTPVATCSGSSLTLADLLPAAEASEDELTRREYEKLARHHAARHFLTATLRERMAVLARALGLPLSHQVVTRAAGCGKTVLSQTYRELVEQIGQDVQRRYPDEGKDGPMLAMMILQKLRERTFVWGKAETACAEIFMVAREQ